MTIADGETGSIMESSDNGSDTSDSPPEEKETHRKQPRTWNEAYGKMQKLVLSKKLKSHASAKVRGGKSWR